MKFTYYGHSTFLVEIKDHKILIDPFISPNELARDIDISTIRPDVMLITHGHEDHVADALPILENNPDCLLVSNFEIVNWFQEKNVKNAHPMNHGGTYDLGFAKVKYVNAVHSSIMPDGAYGGNPGGFIIFGEEKAVYYAGDTALTTDMQLIPRFAAIDLAILPIGDNFTMGYEDAIVAAEFVECNRVVGMHYDTFPPIKIDKDKAIGAFKEAGLTLTLLPVGQSITV